MPTAVQMLATAANCLRSALGCGHTGGQPLARLESVSEAEARRKEHMSEARRQGAETLKRHRAERGDDFYERKMRMSSEICRYIKSYIIY